MAQEWILSNFREGFDYFEYGKTTENTRTDYDDEGVYRWRRYEFTLERYWKYSPPGTLAREDMGAQERPYNITVNAANGEPVDTATLINTSLAGEEAWAELVDRIVQYNVNEANIVMVTEVWQSQNAKYQWWDEVTGTWNDEGEAP